MTTLEKCTRRIIELIHGLPYDEAVKKECFIVCDKCFRKYRKKELYGKITIGRVMQVFKNKGISFFKESYSTDVSGTGAYLVKKFVFDDWKMTKENGQEGTIEDQSKENGQEGTLEDQSKETIKEIYELIK